MIAPGRNSGTRRLTVLLLAAEQLLFALRSSWISLLSILLGMFVLLGLSQTSDLLLDSTASHGSWIVVFLITSIFWSTPVYRESRIALASVPKFIVSAPTAAFTQSLSFWGPIILGAGPYLIFLLAILRSRLRTY